MSAKTTEIYPEDALANATNVDVVTTSEARTLDELFRERVRRSPNNIAYCQFNDAEDVWQEFTWAQIAAQVERWQVAFKSQGLVKGDRVAVCYKNSVEWVIFDQAALRLGLVVVPLYTADRPDNSAYVLANSRARLVLMEGVAEWSSIAAADEDISCVESVLVFSGESLDNSSQLRLVADWLPEAGQHLERGLAEPDDLASIVYTSGTTGRPKGVMLSHRNMLSNAYAGLRSVALPENSQLLSFLPLSHTLERTVGYYAAVMAGACTSFNRSIPQLAEDMRIVQPTVLVTVPRIFERLHTQIYQDLSAASALQRWAFTQTIETGWLNFLYQQGRAKWRFRLLARPILDRLVARRVRDKLGGCLEAVIVGGAPLTLEVAKTFISLGIPLLQGYGLTEASPVVSANTLKQNKPESIGLPLRGVKVKIGAQDELWVKGDNVMMGYWGMPDASASVLSEGWLRTGDRAQIDTQGFIRIIGRIKDILVLANGEKVPPQDIETAILRDPLFEQAIVLGEGKSYLVAIAVCNAEQWQQLAEQNSWPQDDLSSDTVKSAVLQKIDAQMADFPGYARVRNVHITLDEWTIESGLMTPTLKVKRPQVISHYATEIEALYAQRSRHTE